jgi:exopolysaccharide biosynthesis polyprenyl glycosylphosphotransferase
MLRRESQVFAVRLFIGDALSVTAAFLSAFYLRLAIGGISLEGYRLNLHLLAIALPVVAVTFYSLQLYRPLQIRSVRDEVGQTGKGLFAALFAMVLFIFWLKYTFASRLFFALFVVFSSVFVVGQRLLQWRQIRRARSKARNLCNVVIVGTGKRALDVADALRQYKDWGVRILGHIQETPPPETPTSVSILGNYGTFLHLMQEHQVDEVIVAVPHRHLEEAKDVVVCCVQLGIPAWIDPNPFDEDVGPMITDRFAGLSFLGFPSTRQTDIQHVLKRCFDFVVSLVLLVVFSPLMAVVAVLIKLDSTGPVIFSQKRVGLYGRKFTLYKFRTMILGAEGIKSHFEELNEMDGPVFKIRNDPRITRLGRFLRRASLDELPQLFNVLKGDMSVVGPRPPLPEEVEKYEVWQRRRLSMKQGLTCLWQANGRNTLDFKTWMKLDLDYIDNWSWWLDLKILLRTIPAIFRGQ